MEELRYGIIDMQTGELIRQTNDKKTAKEEAEMTIAKDMLVNPSVELIKYMYKIMKTTGKIDQYGMIKVDGLYVGEKFFEIGATCGTYAENFIRLKSALSIRGFIKKTPTTDCHTWQEVMEILGITTSNKKAMASFKRILTSNDVVRERILPSGNKVFVVNPNILRHGSHTSDMCIATFKDIVLDRVDKYNTYLMFINGLLEYEDIK